MTGRNSHHYCYDVSYQCWFASEETKIYCYNFNRSNAVVCSHPIVAYTVPLAVINAAGLERNGCFFFYLYWGMLWLKRTSTESLQIELVVFRGSVPCEQGGPEAVFKLVINIFVCRASPNVPLVCRTLETSDRLRNLVKLSPHGNHSLNTDLT